jgi:branched-chain amino acid transport system ATP-binding protein
MSDALLQVIGLYKSYGAVQASNNFDLDVASGEIHALIGPNGAGKTTILNQLSGELKPDAGRIFFNGRKITGLPVHKRARLGLARSYQITSIFEQLTVKANLSLAIQAHCGHSFRFWKNAGTDPELSEPLSLALERVGLEDRAGLQAGNLSHGEKRQLEVGMALAGNPKMLLLDEPYAGMGPGGTVELSKLIRKIKENMTILLVEHDMNVVFSLADRITVLVYGEAVAGGTPEEIRSNPVVRQAYLGDEAG